MKIVRWSVIFCTATCLVGCLQFSHSSTEQRIVELPANNPDATLKAAAQIGQSLLDGGLADDVQKQFPSLTKQQLLGVFVAWHDRLFQGQKTVFLATGIQYVNKLPEAGTIADYCESRVRQAVDARFPKASELTDEPQK